jgi:hypothetical protein
MGYTELVDPAFHGDTALPKTHEDLSCFARNGVDLPVASTFAVVNDFADLLDLAVDASTRLGCRPWFRGQSCFDWHLIPSVRRTQTLEYERSQNFLFQMKAHSRYAKCPDQGALPDWLTLMQHYGVPTRLLDWTESALIAAYFAVEDQDGRTDAAIWALSPYELNRPRLNSAAVPSLAHRDVHPLVRGAFEDHPCDDCAVGCYSPEVDMRMLVQQGAYTVHGGSTPLDKLEQAKPHLLKYRIPLRSRRKLRESLTRLNIRRSTLFPDLANLAQDFKATFVS